MKQSLTAWQALETYQKVEYHPKNLKASLEASATQQEDNMEAAYTGGEEYNEMSTCSEEGGADSFADVNSCILATAKTEDDACLIKSKQLTEESSQADETTVETPVSFLIVQRPETEATQPSEAPTNEPTETSTGHKPLLPIDLIMLVKTWNLEFDGFKNPFEFVERLEEMVQLYRIDIDQLPNLMPMFLSKDALTWYRNNRRCWETWEGFRTDLLGFFLPAKFKEDQKNAIRWRWQRPGESFKSYMLALQSLMRVTDLTEEEQLNRIYTNSKPELRLYVKRENFRTLPELISYANDYELICHQQKIHQCRHCNSKGTCERCENMDSWSQKRSKSSDKDRKGCYRSRSSFDTVSSTNTHSRGDSSNDEDSDSHDDDDDDSSMSHRKPVKVLHSSKRHHGMNKDAITTPSTSTINSNHKNRSTDTQSRSSISKESTYRKRSKST